MSTAAIRLLLIEDSDLEARIYQVRLRKADGEVTVTRVSSLAEAITACAARQFDAALLDLNLTDSFGVATLERLLRGAGMLPVVVLTGEEDESEAFKALKLGAQEFIKKKDFDPALVIRIVRYAIERRAAELERKQMSAQLLNAQRLESLGQLAAGIAHEINTPIQFIGDNTTFTLDSIQHLIRWLTELRRSVATDPGGTAARREIERVLTEMEAGDFDYLRQELPKALEQTLEGVGRVTQIVRAMKELAHPGSDTAVATDLHHLLETAATVSRNAWKYCADVERDFDPTLPPIVGYPAELNQAFLNLIVNAAQAIEDVAKKRGEGFKGVITLATKRFDDYVEIRIRDNGCGIPEPIRQKVFDPFFTTKEPGRGTGQGLSIVFSAIVGKHGGDVRLESEEGVGTCFVLRIPRMQRGACETSIQPEVESREHLLR